MNGFEPTVAEGREAHFMLQLLLAGAIPGVKYEVPIPHSSINGNTGRADIVYTHNGITEIYEIKPGSYAPGAVNHDAGAAQLQRYIANYNHGIAMEGTSLFPITSGITLPSTIHPDKLIKYYVYPSDPGMIYWSYIKKPERRTQEVRQTEKEEVRNTIINEETLETVETVAITGVIIFALYEVIKWGVAAFFAPPTAGGSLVAAGCLP